MLLLVHKDLPLHAAAHKEKNIEESGFIFSSTAQYHTYDYYLAQVNIRVLVAQKPNSFFLQKSHWLTD